MRKRLLRVLTWLVTAGLLFILFRRISLPEVIAAARAAPLWVVPAVLFLAALIYLCDSFAIWKTFGWFLARMSFREVLGVRGATYLLAAINYNVGQGAIVYFVNRTAGVPIMRGVATVLLIMGINMLALLLFATLGLTVAADVPHAVTVVVAIAWLGFAFYAAVVALRPRWLRERPLFDVLLGAGLAGHARALLVRLPHIVSLFACQLVILRAFGVAVPPVVAVATLPVVFLIAALPISVQGLGTSQAALVFFFGRYAGGTRSAQEAAVITASLVGQDLVLLFQVLVGLVCMRSRVGRVLSAAVPATPSHPG